MEVLTKSAEETKRLGRKMASQLTAGQLDSQTAKVLALSGELGSGKTTFAQGLAEGLGIKRGIISPTFILMRKYKIGIRNNELGIRHLYHLDLYRLETNIEEEVRNLGIEEIWMDPENLVIIEWAEKIKNLIPRGAIWLEFESLGNDRRRIRSKEISQV